MSIPFFINPAIRKYAYPRISLPIPYTLMPMQVLKQIHTTICFNSLPALELQTAKGFPIAYSKESLSPIGNEAFVVLQIPLRVIIAL